MCVHRRQRYPNIESTPGRRVVFDGAVVKECRTLTIRVCLFPVIVRAMEKPSNSCVVELLASIFYSFKAGIASADAISSLNEGSKC